MRGYCAWVYQIRPQSERKIQKPKAKQKQKNKNENVKDTQYTNRGRYEDMCYVFLAFCF